MLMSPLLNGQLFKIFSGHFVSHFGLFGAVTSLSPAVRSTLPRVQLTSDRARFV